ncbi:MAG: hypothetical protein ACJAW3_000154 [Lentimonas sp.]|jgi:hypothetical protein
MDSFTWAVIFGVFGMTFFVYGKKQKKSLPFWAGISLMVFPPFISNLYLMIACGIIVTILPFIIRE